jgi:hypothetical protein
MRTLLRSLAVLTSFCGTALPLLATPLTIMPLGDSITLGVNSTDGSGYRDPLYTDLNNSGISFTFVGSTTSGSDATLISAGDAYHNGYGHYQIPNIDANLNADVPVPYADDNAGGDWLIGPNANPNVILLEIGTNDFLQQAYANIDQKILTLATDIHNLSPNSKILIAGAIPIKGTGTNPYGDAGASIGYYPLVAAYDSYIQNTLVNLVPDTIYVDQRSNFLNADGSLNFAMFSADGIHPSDAGYAAMATTWDAAIVNAEAVPEPGTWTLLGAGGLALSLFGRLREKLARRFFAGATTRPATA